MSKKWRTQVGEVNVLSGQIAIIDPISLEGRLDGVTEVIKDLDKIFPVTISTGTLEEGIFPIYFEEDAEGDFRKSRIIIELGEKDMRGEGFCNN